MLGDAPRWRWKARPSELDLTETATMLVLGPLIILAAIASFSWLLFTLAAFALPCFVGLTVGMWALQTGAGALGGIIVGIVAGCATFGISQMVLAFAPWTWLRLLIISLFVAPAAVAGYSATHGIAQMAMPSATWQMIFSVIGAIAVSVTTFIRFTGIAAPGRTGRSMARG
jgi:hypothetical protein